MKKVFGSAALALLLLGGCGGKVVLESGSGAGGAGGSPGSSGSGASSGGTTTSSSGSSGGTVKGNCELVCDALIQSGCTDKSCFEACLKESNSPNCGGIFSGWMSCTAENLGQLMGCTLPFECQAYEQKYLDCSQTTGCGPQSCGMGSDGSCFCSLQCNGITFESQCFASPGGSSTCLCNMNGMPVGKCEDPKQICDVNSNCCSGIFFGDGAN